MKASHKILALMAVMAASVAGAQATDTPPTTNPNGYTAAGQGITNIASATYTVPGDPTPKTSTSNTVTTTVLPKPGFDIVYYDGTADGSGDPNNPANSATANTPHKFTVKPGETHTEKYYVVNTGNADLTVNLSTLTKGTGVTTTISSDSNGTTPITSVTLPDNGQPVAVYVRTTVPATAASTGNYDYGSTLVGKVIGTGTAATQNGIASGVTLNENQSVDANGQPVSTDHPAGTDLQYVAIEATPADLGNHPNEPGGSPPTGTVTPPGSPDSTPPGTPNNPVPGYNGGTPPTAVTPPGGGNTPGTTPIVVDVNGDKQEAYPPADTNNTPDTVVFTNTVTNGAGNDDTVTLKPKSNGWTKTGTGTWTNGTTTVQFIDPSTNALTDTVKVPAKGRANYITQVTYPDSNPNQGTGFDNPKDVTVVITATSGNNPNVSADTTDIVHPAAAAFGDKAEEKQNGSLYSEDPSKAYYPGSTLTAAATLPGAIARYPMAISNTGTYADTYTLQGYVNIPLENGTTKTVPVTYTGTDVAQTGTTTVNGVSVPVYTTSNVPAGGHLDVTANVAVPDDALATGTTEPMLQQTVTGKGSTIVMTDNNDPLKIGAAGSVVVGKFTQTKDGTPAADTQYATGNPATVSTTVPAAGTVYVTNPGGYDGSAGTNPNTSYLPGTKYSYKIVAKSGYNGDIAGFSLSDRLNSALTYVSATCDVANNKTTVSPSVSANGQDVTCSLGNGTLSSGATVTLTITVTLK